MKASHSILLTIFCSLLLSGCDRTQAQSQLQNTVKSSFNPYCISTQNQMQNLRCQLSQAQQKQNLSETIQVAKQISELLGTQAGVPDKPNSFESFNPNSVRMSSLKTRTAYSAYRRRILQNPWWNSSPEPKQLNVPLRNLAYIVTGTLAARESGTEDSAQLLKLAQDVGQYLLKAQEQAGTGGFPFPVSDRGNGRPMKVAREFIRKAEQVGKSSQVTHNNWIIDDLGDGGLLFDNGLCGVAMLQLYQATGNKVYLDSAIASAEWAMQQPVVPNWNYNSFSVYLLAYTYHITGETRFLESAKEIARLGIYPGQLKTGKNRGFWADPHNARLVYHYIIIRGLGALVAVLPPEDPDFVRAQESLSLALRVGNEQIIERGVTYPNTILAVLSQLQLWLPPSERLADEGRSEAFKIVSAYATDKFLKGKLPVQPDAWGLFLWAMNKDK